MRRLVAVFVVCAALLPAPAAGTAAGAGPSAQALVPPAGGDGRAFAQDHPDHGQDDELEQGERVGHGTAKDLPATSLLATVAVIAGGSLAVVLAGLGVFRRRSRRART